jgi:hypothetical protein
MRQNKSIAVTSRPIMNHASQPGADTRPGAFALRGFYRVYLDGRSENLMLYRRQRGPGRKIPLIELPLDRFFGYDNAQTLMG